ncbi:hypothetical protein EDC04DRAFT_2498684, partial [Pisolithus marmoratus]
TSHGTKNLLQTMRECNTRHNVGEDESTAAGAQQTLEWSISEYIPARHRAIIAMQCCVSKRPFNMVQDPHYAKEVQLLWLGTSIPSPSTVSHDVNLIYEEGSKLVKEYFTV